MKAYRVRLRHPQLPGEARTYTVNATDAAIAGRKAVRVADRDLGRPWLSSFHVVELTELEQLVR